MSVLITHITLELLPACSSLSQVGVAWQAAVLPLATIYDCTDQSF